MYNVSKGPSKIVAKSRRGLSQNFEKFDSIKGSGKKTDLISPEKNIVPRPVFQQVKKPAPVAKSEEVVITPQHEEIIKYINDSWNIVVAQNPYDTGTEIVADANNNNNSVSSASTSLSASASTSASSSACSSPQPSLYCVEPPSPVLSDFKPFDLESWWGRRLFNSITKSL